MRYRFLGVGLLGFAAAVWMACSGDDRTDATTIGAEGQACLPGDQCIAGFTCVGGKCVTSNVGGGVGGDGGTATGNPAATPTDCEEINLGPQPLCPTPDAGDALCNNQDRYCCPGVGCVSGNDSCAAPEGKFECFGTAQCGAVSNGHCCLTIQPGAGDACQPSAVAPTAGSSCTGGADTACGDQDIELCTSQDDCPPNATCTKIGLEFKGVDGTAYTKTISYCQLPPSQDGGAEGGHH